MAHQERSDTSSPSQESDLAGKGCFLEFLNTECMNDVSDARNLTTATPAKFSDTSQQDGASTM